MKIDARGKQCPLPVIEAKNALKDAPEGEIMEILVDNEIAVQNLLKMADHKGLTSFTASSPTFGMSRDVQFHKDRRQGISGENRGRSFRGGGPEKTGGGNFSGAGEKRRAP